ncbi:hypothetical protein ANOM_008191 [Aspergillus nomiae NRRL 13137]|uniref:Uncharacterized protein n=1 Tax=Aspergillus nomiae NRRL (strain ATCC 15546 / NRRL 13137 / CBS 260.88 / M93) TaxID=1509407 RepID=A0A0L1ITR6_ASPN3|nr:uncharacterized protein ANOM_008191 [Aspergillus nomiae NRRL 13137]KNG82897.1 hypothetical protein ANOM_008191 [Aspergillus nomiae NRRL 13137]
MAAASPNRTLSRPLSSTHTGFSDLPIYLRNRIYRQVLAVSHPIFLFQDPRCPIESFTPEKPSQSLALLYTNRQVSKEAKAVLYSTNEFALEESTKRQASLVKSFLNCIGPANAGFLSYLRMDFPAIERVDGQLGEIKIGEDGLQTLRLLQEQCTNLKTLETLVYGPNYGLLTDQEINVQLLRDVLEDINTQFRAIESLDRIIVKVCSGSASPPTIEFMEELGWIVFT